MWVTLEPCFQRSPQYDSHFTVVETEEFCPGCDLCFWIILCSRRDSFDHNLISEFCALKFALSHPSFFVQIKHSLHSFEMLIWLALWNYRLHSLRTKIFPKIWFPIFKDLLHSVKTIITSLFNIKTFQHLALMNFYSLLKIISSISFGVNLSQDSSKLNQLTRFKCFQIWFGVHFGDFYRKVFSNKLPMNLKGFEIWFDWLL